MPDRCVLVVDLAYGVVTDVTAGDPDDEPVENGEAARDDGRDSSASKSDAQ